MDKDIGVSSDGGGKMGIEIGGETIVSKLLDVKIGATEICGFIHASGCHDSDQLIEERIAFTTQPVKTLCQLLR
jgi:hypothetical protein